MRSWRCSTGPKGRLVPTERGMRLYHEIDRIFSGVQQIENAVDAIRREEQGRIAIGVMPALGGIFAQQVTMRFLARHPQAFCVVECRSSQRITEWLLTRELDVGLVSMDSNNPYLVNETLMEHPLVCIMPAGHKLAGKKVIRPADLDGVPFISFRPESAMALRIVGVVEAERARLNVVLVATMAVTLCEVVAAGHGVSLVHPAMAAGFGKRMVVRPFSPAIPVWFQVSRCRDGRNARLVADFVTVAHEAAREILAEAATVGGLG